MCLMRANTCVFVWRPPRRRLKVGNFNCVKTRLSEAQFRTCVQQLHQISRVEVLSLFLARG